MLLDTQITGDEITGIPTSPTFSFLDIQITEHEITGIPIPTTIPIFSPIAKSTVDLGSDSIVCFTHKGMIEVSLYVAIDGIIQIPQIIPPRGTAKFALVRNRSTTIEGKIKGDEKRSITCHVWTHDEDGYPKKPLWCGTIIAPALGPIDLVWNDIRIIHNCT